MAHGYLWARTINTSLAKLILSKWQSNWHGTAVWLKAYLSICFEWFVDLRSVSVSQSSQYGVCGDLLRGIRSCFTVMCKDMATLDRMCGVSLLKKTFLDILCYILMDANLNLLFYQKHYFYSASHTGQLRTMKENTAYFVALLLCRWCDWINCWLWSWSNRLWVMVESACAIAICKWSNWPASDWHAVYTDLSKEV